MNSQPPNPPAIPVEGIQDHILVIRGHRVVLDADLAVFYGVSTSRLNEAVKRNAVRFPSDDFRFQLTREEFTELGKFVRTRHTEVSTSSVDSVDSSQTAMSSRKHRGAAYLPWAFTEHGVLMAASILNSPRAVQMSVLVIRAFVRLRRLAINHKAIATKLAEIDARIGSHDEQIASLVKAIRVLTTPSEPTHERKIGFHRGNR